MNRVIGRLVRPLLLATAVVFPYCRGRGEKGQAMVEYIVALAGAVVGLIVFSRLMQIAVFRYLQPIYFWVGLPIP